MCNLYRMTKGQAEVASWFGAMDEMAGANFGAEVYPGYPGAVIADGALRQMNWGFPLVLTGKNGQTLKLKPVNNARTDKLGSAFWKSSFEACRCLIPLTAWAEAEGVKGAKTRTWMSIPDAPLFAAAGVWRRSDEWGECYSMVMTDSAGAGCSHVHARMPVILAPSHYARWLSISPDQVLSLCRAWDGSLSVDRTLESWTRGSSSGTQARLL